jgi:hypothetical protein
MLDTTFCARTGKANASSYVLQQEFPELKRRYWGHQSPRSASAPTEQEVPEASAKMEAESLAHVASSYLSHEAGRSRKPGEPRRAGSITAAVLSDRRHDVKEFMRFINGRHGPGSAGRLARIVSSTRSRVHFGTRLIQRAGSTPAASSASLQVGNQRTAALVSVGSFLWMAPAFRGRPSACNWRMRRITACRVHRR